MKTGSTTKTSLRNKKESITRVSNKLISKRRTRNHGNCINKPLVNCFDYNDKGIEKLEEAFPGVTFLHSNDDLCRKHESKIMITQIPVLSENNNELCWGVCATEDIAYNEENPIIGEYLGELSKKKKGGLQEDPKEHLYTFELRNGDDLNASRKRSWTAMVNTALSEEAANVMAEEKNGKLYYTVKEDCVIKAGEQIVIYYGTDFRFPDQRFLNPSDNWKESLDRFNEHEDAYFNDKRPLNDALMKHLEQDTGLLFAVPNNELSSLTEETIDIPALAYDASQNAFLPQHQQENLTNLHLACWEGNITLVEKLLELYANPNRQTTIHGYSPLHLVALSTLDFRKKKQLIQIMLNQFNASLTLQDFKNRTVLHIAIENKDAKLVKLLLSLDEKNPKKSSTMLKECVTDDNKDYILSTIETGDIALLQIVLGYVTPLEINNYLQESEEWDQLEKSLQTLTKNQTEFDAITNTLLIFIKNNQDLSKEIKKEVQKKLIETIEKIKHDLPKEPEIMDISLTRKLSVSIEPLENNQTPSLLQKAKRPRVDLFNSVPVEVPGEVPIESSITPSVPMIESNDQQQNLPLINTSTLCTTCQSCHPFSEDRNHLEIKYKIIKTRYVQSKFFEHIKTLKAPYLKPHWLYETLELYDVIESNEKWDDCFEKLKKIDVYNLNRVLVGLFESDLFDEMKTEWRSCQPASIFHFLFGEIEERQDGRLVKKSRIGPIKQGLLLKILSKETWFLDKLILFSMDRETFVSFWDSKSAAFKEVFLDVFDKAEAHYTKQTAHAKVLNHSSSFFSSRSFSPTTPIEEAMEISLSMQK